MKMLRTWLPLVIALLLCPLIVAQQDKKDDTKKGATKDTKKDEKKDEKPPAAPKPELPAPTPGFKDIRLGDEKDELTTQEHGDLRRLLSGSPEAPTGERRKQLLDKASRWYVYRLTWPEVQAGREGTVSQIMDTLVGGRIYSELFPTVSKSADPDADEKAKRARQVKFIEELRPIITVHIQKVLETNTLIARLNAMRLLHRIADLGQEEVVDDFTRAIENPAEHDAVRLWAFHGLSTLLSQQHAGLKVKDAKRMDQCLLAVCKWLEERSNISPTLVAQMAEDERDGISYVRRAAVRALGNSHRPMVRDGKDGREGPIAQLLVRLISTEESGLASPPPTWKEGVEAAHALAQLQAKQSPTYQPDFAAHQLAKFVAALGSQAVEDTTRDRQQWKYYGYHLHNGLALMGADATDAARGADHVKKAVSQMNPVIENLLDNTKNNQAAQELFRWVGATTPKATAVYNPPLQ